MNSVLLTGGTGMVGKAVLERLLGEGLLVYCIGRRRPGVEHENLRFIEADLSADPGPMMAGLPEADAAVHCAAYIGGTGSPDELQLYQSVNMASSEALFRHCRDAGIKRVVYMSTMSILRKPLMPVIDEGHPLAPLTPYAVSKYWGELALFAYASGSYEPVSLRISSPVPADYRDLQQTVLRKWVTNAIEGREIEVYGSGERTQDYVFASDVASGVYLAVKRAVEGGVYNIASGRAISMKRLAEVISGATGGARVVSKGSDANESDRWNISIDKARRDLGFSPVYGPEEAVREMLGSCP